MRTVNNISIIHWPMKGRIPDAPEWPTIGYLKHFRFRPRFMISLYWTANNLNKFNIFQFSKYLFIGWPPFRCELLNLITKWLTIDAQLRSSNPLSTVLDCQETPGHVYSHIRNENTVSTRLKGHVRRKTKSWDWEISSDQTLSALQSAQL